MKELATRLNLKGHMVKAREANNEVFLWGPADLVNFIYFYLVKVITDTEAITGGTPRNRFTLLSD